MANVQPVNQRRTIRVLNGNLPSVEIPTTVNLIPAKSLDQGQMYQTNVTMESAQQKINWILVNWDSNGQSFFHIINARDLIGSFTHVEPGNLILFRSGNSQIQAKIISVSESKKQLEDELHSRINSQQVIETNDSVPIRKQVPAPANANGERIIIGRLSRPNAHERPMSFDIHTQTPNTEAKSDLSLDQLRASIASLMEMQKENDKKLNLILQQQSQVLELATGNRQSIDNIDRQLASLVPQIRTTPILVHNSSNSQHPSTLIQYSNEQIVRSSPENNLVIDEYREDQTSTLSFSEATNMSMRSDSVNMTDSTEMEVLHELEVRTPSAMNAFVKRDIVHQAETISEPSDANYVYLGENKTRLDRQVFESINWASYKAVTRKLLISLFPRNILATHSLTGRPSPAFHDRNRPAKDKLDQNIIGDIVSTVVKYCKVPESLVRTAITTKCADENKMSRQRQQKRKMNESDEQEHLEVKRPIVKIENKENLTCLSNS